MLKLFFKLILLAGPILISGCLNAQEKATKVELMADFREYLTFLEATHPDPYSPFGGKIDLYREAQRILREIPEEGLDAVGFQNLISSFGARLHDGHTFVMYEEKRDRADDKVLNLDFKILSDGIVISRSPGGKLNGLRVSAVNDIPIDSLLVGVQSILPCENAAGACFSLIQVLMMKNSADRLLGHPEADGIRLTLIDGNGRQCAECAEYVDKKDRDITGNARLFDPGLFETKPFEYEYIGGDKKVVWMAYNSTFAREVVEMQKHWGQDYNANLHMLYDIFGLGEIPSDYGEAVQKIPSLSETFFAMLEDMKRNRATHLIVDLRRNGGGWNPINSPTLYMLKGDAYFGYRHPAQYITRLSEGFLQKMNVSIEEYNARNGTDYSVGDYSFSYFDSQWPEEMSLEERRIKYSENNFGKESTSLKLLDGIDGNPVYTPRIVVVTSPETFSAAFQYAFHLREVCGAAIVGVPSSQGFNSGMGTTFHTLTHTKTKVSVSNSVQVFDPNGIEADNMLQPDFPLSWEVFMNYNCSEDAEIRYVLDLIRTGKI